MKKVLKVSFLVLFAALAANAGYDAQRYQKARSAAQYVVNRVRENPLIKEVEIRECGHVSDTWICDARATSVDGEEFEAFLPVPDSKIR